MGNIFSIEDLLWEGSSFNKQEKPIEVKNHGGFKDIIVADMVKASEELDFINTYSLLNRKTTSDKARMLKRIYNIYGRNIYDKRAKNSIERYCESQMYSLEEGFVDRAKNLIKQGVDMVRKLIRRVINFIRKVINYIVTFATQFLAKDVKHWKLVDKNPFVEGEKYLDFSTYNINGAKNFVKKFQTFEATAAQGVSSTQVKDQTATENSIQGFIESTKKEVRILEYVNDKDTLDDHIAFEMFGMKFVDGNAAYKRASLMKIIRLRDLFDNNGSPLLKELENVNKKIDIAFDKISKMSPDTANPKDVNNAATTGQQKMQGADSNGVKKTKDAIVRFFVNIGGKKLLVADSNSTSEFIKFTQNIIQITSKTTSIAQQIVNQIKKLVVVNDGVDKNVEEQKQKERDQQVKPAKK